MAAQNPFRQVGAHWKKEETKVPSHRAKTVPWGAVIILLIVVAAAIGAPIFSNHDVSHYYIDSLNAAPGRDFYFGTDSLGRDLFSCLLYGSRVSLAVGFFSMVIATVTGVVYGSVSAMAPRWVDSLLLRLAELLSSIVYLIHDSSPRYDERGDSPFPFRCHRRDDVDGIGPHGPQRRISDTAQRIRSGVAPHGCFALAYPALPYRA